MNTFNANNMFARVLNTVLTAVFLLNTCVPSSFASLVNDAVSDQNIPARLVSTQPSDVQSLYKSLLVSEGVTEPSKLRHWRINSNFYVNELDKALGIRGKAKRVRALNDLRKIVTRDYIDDLRGEGIEIDEARATGIIARIFSKLNEFDPREAEKEEDVLRELTVLQKELVRMEAEANVAERERKDRELIGAAAGKSLGEANAESDDTATQDFDLNYALLVASGSALEDEDIRQERKNFRALADALTATEKKITFIFDIDDTLTTRDESADSENDRGFRRAAFGVAPVFKLIKSKGHRVGLITASTSIFALLKIKVLGIDLTDVDFLACRDVNLERMSLPQIRRVMRVMTTLRTLYGFRKNTIDTDFGVYLEEEIKRKGPNIKYLTMPDIKGKKFEALLELGEARSANDFIAVGNSKRLDIEAFTDNLELEGNKAVGIKVPHVAYDERRFYSLANALTVGLVHLKAAHSLKDRNGAGLAEPRQIYEHSPVFDNPTEDFLNTLEADWATAKGYSLGAEKSVENETRLSMELTREAGVFMRDPSISKEVERFHVLQDILEATKTKKTVIFDVDETLVVMDEENDDEFDSGYRSASFATGVLFRLLKRHGHKIGIVTAASLDYTLLKLKAAGVSLEDVDFIAYESMLDSNCQDARQEDIRNVDEVRRLYGIEEDIKDSEMIDGFFREEIGKRFPNIILISSRGVYKTKADAVMEVESRRRHVASEDTFLDRDVIVIGNGPWDVIPSVYGGKNTDEDGHKYSLTKLNGKNAKSFVGILLTGNDWGKREFHSLAGVLGFAFKSLLDEKEAGGFKVEGNFELLDAPGQLNDLTGHEEAEYKITLDDGWKAQSNRRVFLCNSVIGPFEEGSAYLEAVRPFWGRKPRVLVLSEHKFFAPLISRYLFMNGCIAYVASTQEELKILRNNGIYFDALVSTEGIPNDRSNDMLGEVFKTMPVTSLAWRKSISEFPLPRDIRLADAEEYVFEKDEAEFEMWERLRLKHPAEREQFIRVFMFHHLINLLGELTVEQTETGGKTEHGPIHDGEYFEFKGGYGSAELDNLVMRVKTEIMGLLGVMVQLRFGIGEDSEIHRESIEIYARLAESLHELLNFSEPERKYFITKAEEFREEFGRFGRLLSTGHLTHLKEYKEACRRLESAEEEVDFFMEGVNDLGIEHFFRDAQKSVFTRETDDPSEAGSLGKEAEPVPNILIVEDNPGKKKALREHLMRFNCRVFLLNGEVEIERFKQEGIKFDAVAASAEHRNGWFSSSLNRLESEGLVGAHGVRISISSLPDDEMMEMEHNFWREIAQGRGSNGLVLRFYHFNGRDALQAQTKDTPNIVEMKSDPKDVKEGMVDGEMLEYYSKVETIKLEGLADLIDEFRHDLISQCAGLDKFREFFNDKNGSTAEGRKISGILDKYMPRLKRLATLFFDENLGFLLLRADSMRNRFIKIRNEIAALKVRAKSEEKASLLRGLEAPIQSVELFIEEVKMRGDAFLSNAGALAARAESLGKIDENATGRYSNFSRILCDDIKGLDREISTAVHAIASTMWPLTDYFKDNGEFFKQGDEFFQKLYGKVIANNYRLKGIYGESIAETISLLEEVKAVVVSVMVAAEKGKLPKAGSFEDMKACIPDVITQINQLKTFLVEVGRNALSKKSNGMLKEGLTDLDDLMADNARAESLGLQFPVRFARKLVSYFSKRVRARKLIAEERDMWREAENVLRATTKERRQKNIRLASEALLEFMTSYEVTCGNGVIAKEEDLIKELAEGLPLNIKVNVLCEKKDRFWGNLFREYPILRTAFKSKKLRAKQSESRYISDLLAQSAKAVAVTSERKVVEDIFESEGKSKLIYLGRNGADLTTLREIFPLLFVLGSVLSDFDLYSGKQLPYFFHELGLSERDGILMFRVDRMANALASEDLAAKLTNTAA